MYDALIPSLFPSRPLVRWRPAYVLVEIWQQQLTAQQAHDCAMVEPDSLMTEERFWEIISRPSMASYTRKPWRLTPRGY